MDNKITEEFMFEVINSFKNIAIKEEIVIEKEEEIIQITKGENQTKEWRRAQSWYINGKYNECELYQKELFKKITKQDVIKTYCRINIINFSILSIVNPLKISGGCKYTENFDGLFVLNNITFYINFKFICDFGGAQNRSFRDVYHFVIYQIYFLKIYKVKNIQFINIFDGNGINKYMFHFNDLMDENEEYKNYIFIGDMYEFYNWWLSPKSKINSINK